MCVITLRLVYVYSIPSLWKSKGLLATYNLEIRIAGSSCRPQLFIHLSICENTDKLKFNHRQSASQKNLNMFSVTLELALIMHLTNYGKTYPYTQHSVSNPLLQRPSQFLSISLDKHNQCLIIKGNCQKRQEYK